MPAAVATHTATQRWSRKEPADARIPPLLVCRAGQPGAAPCPRPVSREAPTAGPLLTPPSGESITPCFQGSEPKGGNLYEANDYYHQPVSDFLCNERSRSPDPDNDHPNNRYP
jgi:hypothetical protein